MNNPLISIITACFNSEKTIRDTIESVLNQTNTNIEYILVDGNSTDKTLDIIASYEVAFREKKIKYKWISEKDNGIYDAINKGIFLARGKFIGIIGSDDWYEQNAIEVITQKYKETSADYIHGNIKVYSPSKVFLKERKAGTEKEMIKRMSFFHPSSFIKKNIIDDLKGYSLAYRICSDYDMILKIINKNYSICHINKVITNFSYGGISTSQAHEALKESHIIRVKNGYNAFSSKWFYYKALLFFKLKTLLSKD